MMRVSAGHGQLPEHAVRHALDGHVCVHQWSHGTDTAHFHPPARMKLQRLLRNVILTGETIEDGPDPLGSATVCQKRVLLPFNFQV